MPHRPFAQAARITVHQAAIFGVASLAFLVPSTSMAQDASSTQLKPIVVEGQVGNAAVGPDKTIVAKDSATGTKTDTPIIDIPGAVSVVTQKELETRNVQNLQEALSYTSGVTVDEYGSDDRYDYFRIRGFDQTTLGTYRDGLPSRIPAYFTTSRLEPYGLQRIDILKGSTSTLFGLNSPGGLVNAITKRPQDTFHAETFTTLGDGHQEVGADFGGPIDEEGVWKYRLTGLAQNGDYGYDYTNDDRLYIAPALTISPDAGTSLTILTDYGRRSSSVARGYPPGLGVDLDTFLGEPDFNHFTTKQGDVGYLFEHELTDELTFRSSARYTHIDLDYEDLYPISTDPADDRQAFAVYSNSSRFTIDNQLQYDTSWAAVDSKFLFGSDYTYDDTHENVLMGTAPGVDFYNPVYCGRACINLDTTYVDWRVRQNAFGVYTQEQLTFDDRWIVTLGGRYDHVNTDAHYFDGNPNTDDTADAFTKRAGLTYKFTEGLAAYANYSESFQPLVTPAGGASNSLKPQRGKQYEVGLKYQPDSFDGQFTLALFDLTQTNVPADVGLGASRQIGEVNVKGVEFESKIALNDKLNMTLAYSYWDGEITDDGVTGNAGNRPNNVPKHIASAWVDYTIPGDGWRNDLTFGGGARYVGQLYGDPENTISIPAHVVFDAMARYAISEHLTLQVNATNLFDKKYEATCYTGTCFAGDRRTVLGTLKYTW